MCYDKISNFHSFVILWNELFNPLENGQILFFNALQVSPRNVQTENGHSAQQADVCGIQSGETSNSNFTLLFGDLISQ